MCYYPTISGTLSKPGANVLLELAKIQKVSRTFFTQEGKLCFILSKNLYDQLVQQLATEVNYAFYTSYAGEINSLLGYELIVLPASEKMGHFSIVEIADIDIALRTITGRKDITVINYYKNKKIA